MNAKPKYRPSVSYSFTVRLRFPNLIGMFARILTTISRAGGDIGAVDIVRADPKQMVRDLTVNACDDTHARAIVDALKKIRHVHVVHVYDRVFLLHLGGKIRIQNKIPVSTRDTLSMAYTPGVARVCMAIAEDKRKVSSLTIKQNSVAVVSDGSAVLGLGNIGPEAAMPVMEGKAMLFKEFADIDAYPICLRTQDTDKIVETVTNLSVGFGGINLEDISAPRCFEVEERLKQILDIPVFHDDQHGTAVVVLAAVTNALKLSKKNLRDIRIMILGAGAAGVTVAKMLITAGARHIVCCDRKGIIHAGRLPELEPSKAWLAQHTNRTNRTGTIEDAATGAQLFIGLSGPGLLTTRALRKMARQPIIFAMANPNPEIMPEEAASRARIIATGRSDYPNQINNVLAFPGIFRGALDARARAINEPMKLAAARAIAACVKPSELSEEYIIPSIFNQDVVKQVAHAVADAAFKSGVARRSRG